MAWKSDGIDSTREDLPHQHETAVIYTATKRRALPPSRATGGVGQLSQGSMAKGKMPSGPDRPEATPGACGRRMDAEWAHRHVAGSLRAADGGA